MKPRYLGILATTVIVLLLLFAVGCAKKAAPAQDITSTPAAPTTPTTTEQQTASTTEGQASEDEADAPTPVPDTEPGPGLVTNEALQTGEYTQQSMIGDPQNADSALNKDLTLTPERFSNFNCVKDETTGVRYISVKLTNTNKKTDFVISEIGIAKGYNTYFMTRGMVDESPGCEKETLAPGESTVCTKVGKDDTRYGNTEGTNRITIQSPNNDGKTFAEAVVVNCPE
jgi:hypothetical protein